MGNTVTLLVLVDSGSGKGSASGERGDKRSEGLHGVGELDVTSVIVMNVRRRLEEKA